MLLGKRGSNVELPDDMINPMEISHTTMNTRPKSRQNNKEQRRNSSTFSSYYLNRQAKDLASLMTIEDRKDFGAILEQDFDGDQLVTLPDRKSKAPDGKTNATRAMFSFKSELNSLIGNLQDTT